MSFSTDRLLPGEKIVYQASTSKVAWINAIIVFAALFHVGGLLGLGGTGVTLTNQRLIGSAGAFGRKSINLRHAEIEMIGVRRGLLGWMFGFGNVVVTSKDGGRIVFKSIHEPYVLQQEVDQAVEVAVLGRKLADYDQPPAPAPAPLATRERTLADFDRIAPTPAPAAREPAFVSPPPPAPADSEAPPNRRLDPNQW